MSAESKQRPQLGQRVRITGKVEQKHAVDSTWGRKHLIWQECPCDVTGVYTGYRTVFDGHSEWIDEEVGYSFTQEAHQEVWLIVTHARRNPIRCRPDQVIVEV